MTLTINSKIQRAAQDALVDRVGACVVLDPNTGAVLAMASSPTYNAADFESLLEVANSGDAEDDSILLNRATQALYAPGSTFKVVTLTTALEDGVATADEVFSSPGTMDIGNAPHRVLVSTFHTPIYQVPDPFPVPPVQISGMINLFPLCLDAKCYAGVCGSQRLYFDIADLIRPFWCGIRNLIGGRFPIAVFD